MTQKEIRREQIIEKASELFAQRDFHAVQMDEIAEAANVAKGTLYNHFSSKEDLYISTIRTRLQNLADLLRTKYKSRDDPWKNMRSFVLHYEKFMIRHHHFFRILRKCDTLFLNGSNGELSTIRQRTRGTLEQVLEKGAQLGQFRNVEPEATANLILGMIESQVLTNLNNGHRENGFDTILDLLENGLSVPERKEPV